MEEILKINRITKLDPEDIPVISKTYIPLHQVSDYEEYKGQLSYQYGDEYGPMTCVLIESHHTSDYKIILIKHSDFHERITKFREERDREERKDLLIFYNKNPN